MKCKINKEPNYLYEGICLIIQSLDAEDDFIAENIHISSDPGKYSISMEELDEKYIDLLEFKRKVLSEGIENFKDKNTLRIAVSETQTSVFSLNYLAAIYSMMGIKNADNLTEKDILVGNLYSLINDYYLIINEEMNEENKHGYKNSRWNNAEVVIDVNDIIELLQKCEYNEELKWLILDQITSEDSRNEMLNYLKESQRIIKKYFYLVEDRFNKSITFFENEEYRSGIIEKIFGTFLENTGKFVENYDLDLVMLSYNSAAILPKNNALKEYNVIIGAIIDELMDLTGFFKLNDEVAVEKCKALGDSIRFNIINILSERPYYVKELAELLKISSSTLTHHLSILVKNSLIQMEIDDRKTYYKTRSDTLEELSKYLQMKSNNVKE